MENERKKRRQDNPFYGLADLAKSEPQEGYARVIDFSGLDQAGRSVKASFADSQDRDRLAAIGDHLRETGPDRLLPSVSSDWRMVISRLVRDRPNCAVALEAIASALAWSMHTKGVPYFPPLFLVGPPGVGKTVLAERIAEMFNTSFTRVDMAASSHGARLAGSSANWGNTRPGLPFALLTFGPHAAPVILCDELNLSPSPTQHTHPLAALYTLWEPHAAKRFTDVSVPQLTLDASHVLWIATGNTTRGIPEPLLSRLTVLPVLPFTRKQGAELVQRLFAEMNAAFNTASGGDTRFQPLGDALVEALARHSPRVQKRLLQLSMGRALYQERLSINADDLAHADAQANAIDKATKGEGGRADATDEHEGARRR